MNADKLNSLDQIAAFLDGTQGIAFGVASNKAERYQWVQKTLARSHYHSLGKTDKGLLLRYLIKVSGYSRTQVKRLIKQYRDTGRLLTQDRLICVSIFL